MSKLKSRMKCAVQTRVSGDRTRFEDSKHNLDLTYITKRLIAMAMPASGFEAAYRNDIDDVSAMLNHYHGSNYMVWNLSGRHYDYSKFNNQVLEYYFPDHHSPPLNLLFMIIVSMDSWLAADPLNVAVVHCIGGKGRTGTVMACFMAYKGMFKTSFDALVYFGLARSIKQRGVTQVSQRRYVAYFSKILFEGVRPHPHKLRVRKIMMSSVPRWKQKGCRPYIHIYDTNRTTLELLHTTKFSPETKFYDCIDEPVIWDMDVVMKGDVLFKFYHLKIDQEKVYNKMVEGSGNKKYSSSMFRASIHTAFVDLDVGCISWSTSDLDIYKKPKRFVDEMKKANFIIQVFFELVPDSVTEDEEDDGELAATYHKFFQRRVIANEAEAQAEDEVVQKRMAAYAAAGIGKTSNANGEYSPKKPKRSERVKKVKKKDQEKQIDQESETTTGEGGGQAEPGVVTQRESNGGGGGGEMKQSNGKVTTKASTLRNGMTDKRKVTSSTSSGEQDSKDNPPSNSAMRLVRRESARFSLGTLSRPRLFSFKTTKEEWEHRVASNGDGEDEDGMRPIPVELAEADTDEELEATASNSGSEGESDSDGEKEERDLERQRRMLIEDEIASELARERERMREKQQLEQEMAWIAKQKELKTTTTPTHNNKDTPIPLSKTLPLQRGGIERNLGASIGTRKSISGIKPLNSKEGDRSLSEGEIVLTDSRSLKAIPPRRRTDEGSNKAIIGMGGSRKSGQITREDVDKGIRAQRSPIIGHASLKITRAAKDLQPGATSPRQDQGKAGHV